MVEDERNDTTPESSTPPAEESIQDTPAAEPAGGSEAQLQKQLEEAQNLAEGYRDKLLRKAADFENFKRRTEADFAALVSSANEGLLLSLLPILDDLGRSLAAEKENRNPEAFSAGIEMIRTKFLKILERYGVVRFESEGKSFDVGYHDALLQVPRDDVAPHTVVQEVDPGYMFRDKVLRHAKVVVSTTPPAAEMPNDEA